MLLPSCDSSFCLRDFAFILQNSLSLSFRRSPWSSHSLSSGKFSGSLYHLRLPVGTIDCNFVVSFYFLVCRILLHSLSSTSFFSIALPSVLPQGSRLQKTSLGSVKHGSQASENQSLCRQFLSPTPVPLLLQLDPTAPVFCLLGSIGGRKLFDLFA